MYIAGLPARRVNLEGKSHYDNLKVLHFPTWDYTNQAQRMNVLRHIASTAGRNPKLATVVVGILKKAKVKPRDYKGQATALLKWVQKNIYYVNEPAERLQDPLYTLKVGYGDCDDMIMLLMAMLESINLKWKFVLVAKQKNGKYTRWIEGTPLPTDRELKWAHIYGMVGDNPYTPKKWFFIEPTLKVPFGWDVVHAQGSGLLPELGNLPDYASSSIVQTSLPPKKTSMYSQRYLEDSKDDDISETTIIGELKKLLHPKKLIPAVVAGAVSGIMIALLSNRVLRPVLGIKDKKK